jgi:RNA recognition motif-containing protein
MSIRIYVGNLPEDLSRQELEAVFADAGSSVSTKLITDRKTNKCRGFGFVTVRSDEEADEIIEKFNGFLLRDTPIKLEKALPRSKDKEDEAAPAAGESTAPAPVTGARRKSGGGSNKSKRPAATGAAIDSESVQPDPRWAQDLEKLKQLLAAQTTNS